MRSIAVLVLAMIVPIAAAITIKSIMLWKTCWNCMSARVEFEDPQSYSPSSYSVRVFLFNGTERYFTVSVSGLGNYTAESDFLFNGTGAYDVKANVTSPSESVETSYDEKRGFIWFDKPADVRIRFNATLSGNPQSEKTYYGQSEGEGSADTIAGSHWNGYSLFIAGKGTASVKRNGAYPYTLYLNSSTFSLGIAKASWSEVFSRRMSYSKPMSTFGTERAPSMMVGGIFINSGVEFVNCQPGHRTFVAERSGSSISLKCW